MVYLIVSRQDRLSFDQSAAFFYSFLSLLFAQYTFFFF